jgi:P27 family predicted phage terminase small subunit
MGARGPVSSSGRLGRPLRKVKTANAADIPSSGRPPATLGTVGRRYWRELARAPWIDAADRSALERLCLIYEELEAFRAIIERDGPTSAGSTGQMTAHPLLAVIDHRRASADVLERELGLTPMARQRMHIDLDRPAPLARPSQPVPAEPYARLRGLA